MKLADLHPALLEALATHSVFCMMKFDKREIFFHAGYKDNEIAICLHDVQDSSKKRCRFVVTCGKLPVGVDPVAAWKEACEAWTVAEKKEAEAVYGASHARTHVVDLIMALGQKGIEIPAVQKGLN